MKRFVSIILLVILFTGICSALAESFDLSQYSNEELIALETAIQAEKLARGLAKSATIYSGTYIIGKDIPAGEYSIETVKGAADHLEVYDASGKHIGSYAIGTSSNRSPIGRLELKDGYRIEFDSCTLKLTVYSGGIVFE